MQEEKPKAPSALSLIAGVVILVDMVFISHGPPVFLLNFAKPVELTSIWIFIFGVITSLIVIFGAIMLYFQPKRHVAWSIIILVFTILSTPSMGALMLGLPLGIAGGMWGIFWQPAEVIILTGDTRASVKSMVVYSLKCPQCGRILLQDFKNCPYCGKALK